MASDDARQPEVEHFTPLPDSVAAQARSFRPPPVIPPRAAEVAGPVSRPEWNPDWKAASRFLPFLAVFVGGMLVTHEVWDYITLGFSVISVVAILGWARLRVWQGQRRWDATHGVPPDP